MRNLLLGSLMMALSVGVGGAGLVTQAGCEVKVKKKKKRWKKKHKRNKRWKNKHKYKKPKKERILMHQFFGDKTSVYLARVPVQIGSSKAQADGVMGPAGKLNFKSDKGKISAKVEYGPDGKVERIKVTFGAGLNAIKKFGEFKWGPPTKVKPDGTIKWVKAAEKIDILLKVKNGQTKLAIQKGKPKAAGAMKAPAMMPKPK